jgi:hypothetical protein
MRLMPVTVLVATILLVSCDPTTEAAAPEPVATISDLAGQWRLTA